jgi:hypothetical protein
MLLSIGDGLVTMDGVEASDEGEFSRSEEGFFCSEEEFSLSEGDCSHFFFDSQMLRSASVTRASYKWSTPTGFF